MFSILIVDDEPDNFDVIEILLSSQDYQLHYASTGQEAIDCLPMLEPDLILLDVMMPGIDGIEVCKRIKATPQWEAVPIIIVTALTSKKDLSQCLSAGADDFISKPVNRLELRARVRSMLRIHQQYQQLETFNARLESAVHQRTAQLQSMIFRDRLTQLSSRAHLLQTLTEILQSDASSSVALVCLDCDGFKLVNGSFGHTVGDQLLVAIAQRLRQYISPGNLLARLGGDEFCFLLHHVESEADLAPFIEVLLRSFDAPFMVAHCEIFMTACLGVALMGSTENASSSNTSLKIDAEELLQRADTAMYQAKLRGKGSYRVFDRQMHLTILHRLTLENDLQRALKQQEFTLHYQPIIQLEDQELIGFEALLRWHHPERGMVSPAEFIPCMETTGLIVPVGMVAFKEACQQLHRWHQQGWTTLTMSVNLSVRQFACLTLLADIDRVLAETGVNPACLKLEITETALMENAEAAIALTHALRERQIQISIDDFGTGYSSLNYLHRFPVDILKIDRSFVHRIQPTTRQYHVINTILLLSNQLGLSVIAEGIETTEQLEWLKSMNCEFGQGFLFDQPLAAKEIESLYFSQVNV